MSLAQHIYPLHLQCAESGYLKITVVTMHTIAALLVTVQQGATPEALLIVLLLCLSFLHCRRWYRSCPRLVWHRDGQWDIEYSGKPLIHATLLGSSVVTRYFVLLHLKPQKGRLIAVLIPRDSQPPDAFRRLRVRLLIEGAIQPEAGG